MENKIYNDDSSREEFIEKYDKGTHFIGRLSTAVCTVLFCGAPFVIGIYLGAMPDLSAAAKGYLSVGLVWTVSSVVEFLVYTPMLGGGRRISRLYHRQLDQHEDSMCNECT